MARIKLSKIRTRAPRELDKEETKVKTLAILQELDELQNRLFAEARHSVLVILQGMDASGKDGVIRDVFGSLNPQGVSVTSFKVPSAEEYAHDFLWRIHKATPEKGCIKVFNRSHYEDVLVTRVHGHCDDSLAHKRMRAINDFERMLSVHNNTVIIKCYLHVSQEKQQQRLEERMHIPRKMWKYNEKDFEEAKLWNRYMVCYEEVFDRCSDIPWNIIPADQNWYKSYLVAALLRSRLNELNMQYPRLTT